MLSLAAITRLKCAILVAACYSVTDTLNNEDNMNTKNINSISLSLIDVFPDHPYKILMDENMDQLVESITRRGIIENSPASANGLLI